ncbi:MAG: mechanosensitive ion channel family protein [Rhodothalassiaceae bacterium]
MTICLTVAARRRFINRLACGLILASLCFLPVWAQSAEQGKAPYAYSVDSLAFGLGQADRPIDLTTPQATMEAFLAAARAGDYERAAFALNLSRIPAQDRAAGAADLARQLYFVMDSQVGLNWSEIPDRPAGALDEPRQTGAPPPRRSIQLATVEAAGRSIPINLQRFAPPDGDPVWLVSPHTVAEVPALYAAHGPGFLEQWIPRDLSDLRLAGEAVWVWLALAALILLSIVIGWLLAKLILAIMARSDALWPRTIRDSIGTPLTVTLMLGAFAGFIPALISPTGPVSSRIGGLALALLYLAVIWLLVRLIWGIGEAVSRHYHRRLPDPEHVQARRKRTKISVGRRLVIGVAIFAGIGLLLAQFEVFDTLGLSLLASAGAITVILSIAARPFLENMVAGMQIAATEPVRIGDTLLFEGYWGTVESIAFTYVTIHTWDLRRIIVPHTYLLTHPFENWSKESESRKMVVHLMVDHRMDIDALRQKYLQIVGEDPRWEGEDKRLEVFGVTDAAMDIRVLACGRSSGDTWHLHCHIREQLMKFIQGYEDGRFLVRRRQVLERRPGEGLSAPSANGHDQAEWRQVGDEQPPRHARPEPSDGEAAAEGGE